MKRTRTPRAEVAGGGQALNGRGNHGKAATPEPHGHLSQFTRATDEAGELMGRKIVDPGATAATVSASVACGRRRGPSATST